MVSKRCPTCNQPMRLHRVCDDCRAGRVKCTHKRCPDSVPADTTPRAVTPDASVSVSKKRKADPSGSPQPRKTRKPEVPTPGCESPAESAPAESEAAASSESAPPSATDEESTTRSEPREDERRAADETFAVNAIEAANDADEPTNDSDDPDWTANVWDWECIKDLL